MLTLHDLHLFSIPTLLDTTGDMVMVMYLFCNVVLVYIIDCVIPPLIF